MSSSPYEHPNDALTGEMEGARVTVPKPCGIGLIVQRAGGDPTLHRHWNDGTLIVPGVSQSALEKAFADYMREDHAGVLAFIARRKALRDEEAQLLDEIARLRSSSDEQSARVAALRAERDRLLAEQPKEG